ncbi:response regulator transcription factor [Noviherbaspirillum galbum]|uniref:Response regulator transcription factor n=1 Tax=Noviherbaspirillum galbum TaxID=2709383 RepID=A0A6B3SZU8_9BURK|nr:response regulator transcription factor [Noviherbaspirillum galbum]NEX64679.1 response regulator transcription factor [Noviherbaspirillum galbum]
MKPLPSSIRILLVDDHRTVLWGLRQLINAQKPKMEVVGTATDAQVAVDCARQLRPDVILLDLDLGGCSALDILPELVSSPCGSILLLTGIRDESILDRSILLGARGFVHKQAEPALLLRAIEAVHAGQLWLDRDAAGRVVLKQRTIDREHEAAQQKLARLTGKERMVVQAVAREAGIPNKVLASRLGMSEHTLRNHLAAIYHKLEVKNRVALYLYATEHVLPGNETMPPS